MYKCLEKVIESDYTAWIWCLMLSPAIDIIP